MYFTLMTSLFLLFSVPLFFAIVVTLFFKWDSSINRFKKAFFTGLSFFIAAQIILLLIGLVYKVNYEKLPLFIYIWITDLLVLLIILSAGYFLMVKNGFFRQDSYREYPVVFSYTGGFMVLAGLARTVNSLLKFDGYMLFLYPFVCMILLISFSIIIIEAGTRRGYIPVLLYALLFPLSLLLALIPWLYYTNYIPAAVGITLLAFISTGLVFFLLKKDYIRI
ncbi:MAG: hypothetical protein KAR21_17245 [Spirochaetales bacterium]|nr:hypothetical protein [Spirochaetales bacterium]